MFNQEFKFRLQFLFETVFGSLVSAFQFLFHKFYSALRIILFIIFEFPLINISVIISINAISLLQALVKLPFVLIAVGVIQFPFSMKLSIFKLSFVLQFNLLPIQNGENANPIKLSPLKLANIVMGVCSIFVRCGHSPSSLEYVVLKVAIIGQILFLVQSFSSFFHINQRTLIEVAFSQRYFSMDEFTFSEETVHSLLRSSKQSMAVILQVSQSTIVIIAIAIFNLRLYTFTIDKASSKHISIGIIDYPFAMLMTCRVDLTCILGPIEIPYF